MEQLKIKISKDFSSATGPRYIIEGDYSGELFRKEVLSPKIKEAIEKNIKLTVDLDGAAGYGTSFLEESFGGLIREEHIAYNKILDTLILISNEEPYLMDDIYNYMKDASEKIK